MLRASGGSLAEAEETTLPPTLMRPSDGLMNPATKRRVVVFPQPEGPSRQTRVPLSMAKVNTVYRRHGTVALGKLV